MLGGFSQGAVMSYALGLGAGRPRPAAIVAFSGFLPTVPGYPLDLSLPLPPVAIGHGAYDQVIGVEWGRQARQRLEDAGAEVLYRESPIPHAIDPEYLRDLRAVARGASGCVTGRAPGAGLPLLRMRRAARSPHPRVGLNPPPSSPTLPECDVRRVVRIRADFVRILPQPSRR